MIKCIEEYPVENEQWLLRPVYYRRIGRTGVEPARMKQQAYLELVRIEHESLMRYADSFNEAQILSILAAEQGCPTFCTMDQHTLALRYPRACSISSD